MHGGSTIKESPMGTQRIDIMQEFIDLYKREAMLAFFEFQLERATGEPIRGLCRVSKPKRSPHVPYLSLTFLVDATDDATHMVVDDVLTQLASATFKAALPVVTDVVLVPDIARAAAHYIRQLDLMIEPHTELGRLFIAERLLPALRANTPLKMGDVVWWDIDEQVTAQPGTPVAPHATRSRIDDLKVRLKKLLGTEGR
jgi:hypothetical protein